MENRYLFRGKRIDNSEWVEGDLVHSVYKINDVCVGQYGNEVGMHEVDPSTICQCTGLRDKTGELIWEKDILMAYLDEDHLEDVTYAKVEWNGFGWILQENNSVNQEYLDDFVMENYEVCGNTIDNPELLEV